METPRFCPICGKELLETGFCPDIECRIVSIKPKIFDIQTYIEIKKQVEITWEKEIPDPFNYLLISKCTFDLMYPNIIWALEYFNNSYTKLKVWFKLSSHQSKVGIIIDGFYDGLLQVQEIESKKIYIVAPDEIEET